jgi:carbonic anhydrase
MCGECRPASRRDFLTTAAAGLTAASVIGWSPLAPATASISPTLMTPDEALAKLKEGNAKYVGSPDLCQTDLHLSRAKLSSGQAPWATIVACSDSRQPSELIFGGLSLGHLFVCRNAGNTADTATMGTIEYGAEHLGSPLIVVLGHERCGAVMAACEVAEKGTRPPGSIGPMVDAIATAAKAVMGKEGDFVANAVRESARRTAEKIKTQSEIVRHLIHQGELKVVYAVYDLDTGVVDFLG